MSKVIIKILIVFIILSACSLDKTTKIFKDRKEKEVLEASKIKKLFKENKVSKKEFNPSLKIDLTKYYNKKKLYSSLSNNLGMYNYQNTLDKTSKFKFSKIKTFHKNEPQIVFYEKDVIFFDKKGCQFFF